MVGLSLQHLQSFEFTINFTMKTFYTGGAWDMIDSCDDTCPQDNILEFDKDEQAWYEIGKMKKRRSYLIIIIMEVLFSQ